MTLREIGERVLDTDLGVVFHSEIAKLVIGVGIGMVVVMLFVGIVQALWYAFTHHTELGKKFKLVLYDGVDPD